MPLEHQLAQVFVTATDIPTDRLIFEGVPMTKVEFNKKKKKNEEVQCGPTFTTKQVSTTFFGMSPFWLRWRERQGDTVLDGVKVEPSRTEAHARQYNLADIERLSHALRQCDAITTEVHIKALRALAAVGRVHGLVV